MGGTPGGGEEGWRRGRGKASKELCLGPAQDLISSVVSYVA